MTRVLCWSFLVFAFLAAQSVNGSPCGGLYESDAGRINSPSETDRSTCIWVIKTVSRRNLNLNLERLDEDAVLFVYSEESVQTRALTPIRLTTNEIGSVLNVRGQSVTLILPQNSSRQLSLTWSSSASEDDEITAEVAVTTNSVNYGQSSNGEAEWLDFRKNQMTTWILNTQFESGLLSSLTLVVDTQFQACDLDDPCLCSHFGLFEVAVSGLLREIGRACARPLHIEASTASSQLVAFFLVNPSVARKHREIGTKAKETVSIRWSTELSPLPTTTEYPGKKFRSCLEVQRDAEQNERDLKSLPTIQTIFPAGLSGEAVQVLCDFVTNGGGWTFLQNRGPGPREEFYLEWQAYQDGFGHPSGNHWLGLERMYQLSFRDIPGNPNPEQTLRIELTDWENVTLFAHYTQFYVQGASKNYPLHLGSHSGTLPSSMAPHNGMPFTTKDRDNDSSSENNCGVLLHSGFWFSSCYNVNLNGYYWNATETMTGGGHGNGIVWYGFHDVSYSMQFSQMKIRDSDF